jgi:CRP/FNR family cyclic AMP-dependent transcriptional regulator
MKSPSPLRPPPIPAEIEALVPQTFLAGLPRPLATEVLSMGRRVEVLAGARLTSGTAAPGLAIVVEGLVRSFMTSPQGRQVTVRYSRPGETLGLVQLLRARLDVHAQAVTRTVLWAMSSPQSLAIPKSRSLGE